MTDDQTVNLASDPDELESRHADPALAVLRSSSPGGSRGCAHARGRVAGRRPALRSPSATGRASARGRDGGAIAHVEFRLGGARILLDRRAPFAVTIAPGRLGERRPTLLRAAVLFRDGRELTLERTLGACR